MKNPSTPWHREPMVWLLMLFPMLAVVGGIAMLVMALQSDDGLVVDDYYRRGKEINLELKRDRAAAALGVRARVALNEGRTNVRVELNLPQAQAPKQLQMQLLHATRQGYDRHFLLAQAADGSYQAALAGLAPGHYHVQLATDVWRLLGSLRLPQDRQIEVRPYGPDV